MKSGARKKKLHFLSIGLIYGAPKHDIEIPAQKHYAHNEAPCSPIEPLFSKHPAQQTWYFDFENNNESENDRSKCE